MSKFVRDKVKQNVGKGEEACNKHFLVFCNALKTSVSQTCCSTVLLCESFIEGNDNLYRSFNWKH